MAVFALMIRDVEEGARELLCLTKKWVREHAPTLQVEAEVRCESLPTSSAVALS